MNNYQWHTSIDKLMQWRANGWNRYESNSAKIHLRIHYDQLIILSDRKILESFNMNNKMKGIYKDDVMILIISHNGQEIRKLKFRILTNAGQCYSKLNAHFPVMKHDSVLSKNKMRSNMKYRNIQEVLRHSLNNPDATVSTALPSNYLDFVKLCILDPSFPQMARETEKLLQENNFIEGV